MRSSLLVCFVGLCLWTSVISLKICAFNIQSYGEAKASNKKVMEILMKVNRLFENMAKSEMSLLISTPKQERNERNGLF